MAAPADNPRPTPDEPDEDVRWPAYFQRSVEPLFLLNRRRRLVFVNRAWEKLTGLEARAVRGLVCKSRPKDPGAAWQDLVQSALAPPPEALHGKASHVRRLVPKTERPGPQWWEVHFFPVMSADGLLAIVGKISAVAAEGLFELPPLPERIIALRERRADQHRLEDLQSEVPAMRRVAEQVRLAAGAGTAVLLQGEAGSGKQWLARLIHQTGARRAQPFVCVDCARLPTAVLEGIIGHAGPFRLPDAGTVYLREVYRLPRELQDRLLRWLTASAGDGPRFLAGLRGDAGEHVRAGRLLAELHGALTALVIQVPPLRERPVDIPRLVDALLPRAGAAADHAVASLSADALEVLRSYRWPGNVGEL